MFGRNLRILLLVAVTVIAVAAAWWWGSRTELPGSKETARAVADRTVEYDYDAPAPGSYELPVLGTAGDGAVLLSGGESASLLALLENHVSVLSFIYTRCADPSACPTATGVLQEVHAATLADTALSHGLQLLTFSFDPDHDTPEVMASYGQSVRRQTEGAPWRFLTARSPEALTSILAAYGQRVDRRKDADNPLGPFYHVLRVYLIDPEGRIRNIYSTGLLDPRLVLADVRTLLEEQYAASGLP